MSRTLFADARLSDGRLADVVVDGGRIAAVAAPGKVGDRAEADRVVDCAGRLLAPSFCEGHIHLDKTFLGLPLVPHRPGVSVPERIAAEKALRREIDTPVEERGAALVRQVAAHGTGRLRTHVDIDPEIGLDHLHAVLALKERLSHLVDMQVVAFPQSGIVRSPGVAELLDRALGEGATHVGGLDPRGIDGDVPGHLDVVFSLAQKHDAGVDIHLHDGGETGLMELRDIAGRTRAAGLSGRVVVSHAFALGGPEEIGPTVEALAEARVAILTHGPGPVPMPPVTRLSREGVAVLAGSDNIRDAWSPYGDGDMLRRAMMIGYRQGMNEDAELALLFSIVSERTSATMGFPSHALAPGGAADLVLLDAAGPVEAVATVPPRRLVMKAGAVVAENGALT